MGARPLFPVILFFGPSLYMPGNGAFGLGRRGGNIGSLDKGSSFNGHGGNRLPQILSLQDTCVVRGGQSDAEWEANIQAFQSDVSRIILCNIAAGGRGYIPARSMGELPPHGPDLPNLAHRRIKASDRTHMGTGALSKAIQRFLFAAGSVEVRMVQVVTSKGGNFNALNGDDLIAGLEFLRQVQTHISAGVLI